MTSIILICLIFVGFGLIVFAVFRKEEGFKFNTVEAKEIEVALNNSIEDADSAIEELNKLCADAFDEFEEKYQELLFLYQMIEEKKKKFSSSMNEKPKNSSVRSNVVSKKDVKHSYSNPKLKDIQKLEKQGLAVAEIAKKLNMGQGEVKLISELGKER